MATGNHQSPESVKSHVGSLEKSPSHKAPSSPIAHGSHEAHVGENHGAKKMKSFKEKGGMKRNDKNKGYIKV